LHNYFISADLYPNSFFNQGHKDGGGVSAGACLSGVVQDPVEDFLIETASCTTGHKPVCDIAEAGAVGLIAGLDNAYQGLVERKCSKRI